MTRSEAPQETSVVLVSLSALSGEYCHLHGQRVLDPLVYLCCCNAMVIEEEKNGDLVLSRTEDEFRGK